MSVVFKRPVSVLVVVHTVDGDVLMLSRTEPAGFWQSVTGSLEPGETPAEAAHRELREETGIDAVPVDRRQHSDFAISERWLSRYAPGVASNREHVFTLALDAPVTVKLDPSEHLAFEWVTRARALEMAFSATNRAAIRRWVRGVEE